MREDPSIYEGAERTPVGRFNPEHRLVRIGWWLEPQKEFVRHDQFLGDLIQGSASPVYVEDDNE